MEPDRAVRRRVREHQRAQLAEAEVPVDVAPGERREPGVAHDEAARDRAEAVAGVGEVDHRRRGARRPLAGGAQRRPVLRGARVRVGRRQDLALVAAPPEVQAAAPAGGRGREVDLLAVALADVRDREVAGRAIEREAPRVAQPVRPDRVAERVVGRDGVGARRGAARVDAQDLAEQRVRALRVRGRRVVAVAAVARADVEQPVRPERELAAVVVARLRVRDRDHQPARCGVGRVGVGGDVVLVDLQRSAGAGQIDVGQPAARVVGREGDRQQPALVAGRVRDRAHVEERLGRAARDDLHDAALLDDEHARVAGRPRHVGGRGEVADLRQ